MYKRMDKNSLNNDRKLNKYFKQKVYQFLSTNQNEIHLRFFARTKGRKEKEKKMQNILNVIICMYLKVFQVILNFFPQNHTF